MRIPLFGFLVLAFLLSACAEKQHDGIVTCIRSDGSTNGSQNEGYKAGGCTG